MSINSRRLLLALLIAAGILNYADRQIIAVLKPLLQEQLHWSDADYGNLTAVFQFASAFAFLGTGWLVDRVGWRWANPLAVGSWSLAAMAHAATRTLGQFTVVRAALGATESLGTPTGIKTIAVFFAASERSIALGAMNAAGNVGAIVTPLLIPALAISLGWQGAFLITGGCGILWVAAWMLFTRAMKPLPSQDAEQPANADGGQPVRWLDVLADRRTWAFAGGKALSDPVWWFLLYWAPDFFHRVFHLDMQGFAVPLALVYSAAAIGSLIGGFASGRLIARGMNVTQARKSTMLVCALLVLAVPLALAVKNYWFAVGILGLTLAAHQGFSVNLFALVTDVTPSARVGTTISIAALFGNLAGMGVLRLAGNVIGEGTGYGLMLGMAAVAYLASLTWIHFVLPKPRTADSAFAA
jgi:ACS family hexuronate transporter-like MFS transporter